MANKHANNTSPQLLNMKKIDKWLHKRFSVGFNIMGAFYNVKKYYS